MSRKNRLAEAALGALDIFLQSRLTGTGVSDRDKQAAAVAMVGLTQFIKTAEQRLRGTYGVNPFSASAFNDLLVEALDDELLKRRNSDRGLTEWADVRCLLQEFIDMDEALFKMLVVQIFGPPGTN